MKYYSLLFVAFFTAIPLKSIIAQTLKPGDTDPKAQVVDADVMQEFNNGAAVIKKGTAYALIDKNGNMLAPYNQYDFYYASRRLYNGIFLLGPRKGAINAKGQLIASGLDLVCRNNGYTSATAREGLLIVNSDDQRFLVKGTNGINGLGDLSEGMVVYYTGGAGNMKFGFKNLKDQVVIQPAYDMAGLFSDGMAIVGCKNEFGEMKYGFINKEGQQVIPCIYTYRPSDFYCGRSLVYPKTNTGFEYAYINKKGELAIKYTQEMYQKYGQLSGGFFNGYTFNDRFAMDTSGKVFSYEAFFAKFGVKNPGDKKLKLNFQIHREEWMDGQVFVFSRFDYNNRAGSTTGFIDVATNKVVEGPFFKTNFYFDPVSKLAYAEMPGKDETNIVVKKGYINMQGIFVIVKKEEEKW